MEQKPENGGRNQKGKFKKGASGNPAGKPKGVKHKATTMALLLMESEAEAVIKTVIDAAIGGDMTAAGIIISRLVSPAKDRPVDISLPQIKTTDDLQQFTAALLDAVSSGRIQPSEAEKISKIASAHREAIQLSTFEQRLSDLESAIKGNQK